MESKSPPCWVTPAIDTLRPYVPGKPPEELEREQGIRSALKLASNESALGCSPRVAEALAAAMGRVHRYPDAAAYRLRGVLSERLGVAPSQLVFGNGSNELIELVLATFCTPEHHVIFGEPSFVVYRSAALARNLSFAAVPLERGHYDLEAFKRAVQPNTRVVLIANPNNPTGTYVPRDELVEFLAWLPPHVITCLDEAYFEYATARDFPDGVALLQRFPHLIVLRTFSKAYGLAALRAGYAACSELFADYLNRLRAPFNLNEFAQVAALAALDDSDFLARNVELNASQRERLSAALSALGLTVLPSQTNFVWCRAETGELDWGAQLLQRGIIVRPFSADGRTLRITVGHAAENDRLLQALHDVANADSAFVPAAESK